MGRKLIYDLTLLGIDVLNHARPGWKALHPETLNLLGSETEDKTVAATIATALQQAIGQEQSEATKLINAVIGRLDTRSTRPTSLFEATKSQCRRTFGASISQQLPQALVEHRAA